MKKSRSHLSIPAWFNLSNYEACRDLTPQQWAMQLTLRIRARQAIDFNSELLIHNREQLEALIPKGCDPNQEVATSLGESIMQGSAYFNLNGKSTLFYAIRPIWYAELLAELDSLQSKFVNPADFLDEETRDGESSKEQEFGNNEFSALDDHTEDGSIRVEIDLSAKDSVILEQLKAQLPHWRKLKQIPTISKGRTEIILGKLRQYHILPYLDLTLWSQIYKTKISAETFLHTLFPYANAEESYLRKVASLANSSLTAGFIISLSETQN